MKTPAALTRRFTLIGWFALVLGLAACGGGGGSDAELRALNLASDLPSIDLYSDDTRRFESLATDGLSPYVGLARDTYTLRVRRAGDSATLLSASHSLSRKKHYTAVVWGRETALRLSLLDEDQEDDDIDRGSARLRLFNATTDAGALDVFLTSASADIGDALPTQEALQPGALAGFADLSSGSYRLRVTGAGDPNDLRLDIPALVLPERRHATLILTAAASGVLVNGTLVPQQGSAVSMRNNKARVRVVAGVNGSGVVGASVAGGTLAVGLRSPSVGPYALTDAGSVALTVRVNGEVISSAAQTFAAGADYTLLAYGPQDTPRLRVLGDDNRLPANPNRVKMRLVHGAEGIEPLTLSVDYLALVSDLPAGMASAYATLNADAEAQVDLNTAAAAQPLFSATEVNLQAAAVYTVFLLGGNEQPAGVIRKER